MEAAAQQHKETPRSLTIERGKKAWGYITNTERLFGGNYFFR